MFGFAGYLVWFLLCLKLIGYIFWLWKQGYRLGAAGAVFLALGTLSILLHGTFLGSGLK